VSFHAIGKKKFFPSGAFYGTMAYGYVHIAYIWHILERQ